MATQSLRLLVVGSVRGLADRFGGPGRVGNVEIQTTVMCRAESVDDLGGTAGDTFEVVVMDGDADGSEWVATAQEMHEKSAFGAIVCIDDHNQPTAATIAHMLGLSWHSAETVALILDKTMMRSRLSAAGLDATAHRTVAGAGDVVAFLREQQAPVVLKPTKGTGGVAVAVSTPQEASRAWDELTEQCPPEWGPMVAERQLMGPLLAVDAFSEDGQHAVIGIVRRYNLPGRFVGLDYTCPSGLGEQTEREVADFVVRVLDTLGIVAGPSHTEVILTPEGPQVLETHLRPGGPAVAQVLRDVTGIDLALYMVLHALGMTGLVAHGSLPPLAPPSAKASASCCLVANCEGVVRQIHGREEVLALPGVVEHQLTVEPGQRVGPPRNLDERLGYVRCHGGDPQEALDRCRAAAASIDIWVSALRDPMGPTV